MDLYNKRYKTLAEHRAAVKARATLKKGKNVGPVANADAYGSKIKKPSNTQAVRSASTSTNSSKTTKSKKPKPTPPKAQLKTSPKPAAKPAAKPERRSDGLRNLSKTTNKPKSPRDKMPYAGSFPGETKKTNAKKTTNKPARGTARGGSRASNNNKGRTTTSSGPKKGDTKTATIQGVKYIMTWSGSRWTSKKAKG